MGKKMRSANTQQSFIHGAAVLMISTILVKVIGAIFKIPLGSIIGGTGMGYYSTAYDLYIPIYYLAMAGLPVAISRIVAERVAQQRYNDVRKTLKVVRRVFWVTGLTGFTVMLAASYPFALLTENINSLLGIIIIAPSLLFCCIMSTYRGYYEGFKNMYPTAISSVVEALGKLIIGYAAAIGVVLFAKAEFASKGTVFGRIVNVTTNAEAAVEIAIAPYAAAAALLGITMGSALGALYLVVKYRRTGDNISAEQLAASPDPETTKATLRLIVTIAIPVVLGSLTNNVANLIDVTMVQRQLTTVMNESPDVVRNMYGSWISSELTDDKIPTMLYGCYKGFAYPIYNLVPTITQVLGVSALPALATAWTSKKFDEVKSNIETVLKITALIAMPCGFGIAAVSGNILGLLYSSERAGEIAISTPILMTLGLTAIFSGVMLPMTNMLQSIGKQTVPVKNIAVGALLKIVINFLMVGIPEINIMGAVVGTLACYVYIFSANLYCLLKYSAVRLNVVKVFLKPAVAAICCGAAAKVTCVALEMLMGRGRMVTVLSIVFAAIVYVVMLLVLKVLSHEDIASFPKGKKIADWMQKKGLVA